MASFDKESEIFNWMRGVPSNKVCPLTQHESEEKIYELIQKQSHWIDNSSDTKNPPDYYNDIDGYMMDFMRTNDYEIHKENGKVKNIIAASENRMIKELEASGILATLPNISRDNIICNPKDEIEPSLTRYHDNIKHVLEDHNKQVKVYRKNHPNHKLIFCVCDLSEFEHKILGVKSNGEIF